MESKRTGSLEKTKKKQQGGRERKRKTEREPHTQRKPADRSAAKAQALFQTVGMLSPRASHEGGGWGGGAHRAHTTRHLGSSAHGRHTDRDHHTHPHGKGQRNDDTVRAHVTHAFLPSISDHTVPGFGRVFFFFFLAMLNMHT